MTAETRSIPHLFTAFAIPNPDDCQSMVNDLYRTVAVLSPTLAATLRNGANYFPNVDSPIDTILTMTSRHISDWKGTAADNFFRYLARFPTAVKYQAQLTALLAVMLEAQLEIRRRSLTDIWDIGDKTVKALESLDGWCHTGMQLSTILTIFAAIAAIAAAIPTGGLELLAAAGGAAASVMSLGETTPPTVTIGGPTVAAVVGGMQAAITHLASGIDSEQDRLLDSIRTLARCVNTVNIQVPPPAGLNATRADGADTLRRGIFYDRG